MREPHPHHSEFSTLLGKTPALIAYTYLQLNQLNNDEAEARMFYFLADFAELPAQDPALAAPTYTLFAEHPDPHLREVAVTSILQLAHIDMKTARYLWEKLLQDNETLIRQFAVEMLESGIQQGTLPAADLAALREVAKRHN